MPSRTGSTVSSQTDIFSPQGMTYSTMDCVTVGALVNEFLKK